MVGSLWANCTGGPCLLPSQSPLDLPSESFPWRDGPCIAVSRSSGLRKQSGRALRQSKSRAWSSLNMGPSRFAVMNGLEIRAACCRGTGRADRTGHRPVSANA